MDRTSLMETVRGHGAVRVVALGYLLLLAVSAAAADENEKPENVIAFPNSPGMITLTWTHSGEDVFWFVLEQESPPAVLQVDQDKRAWTVPNLEPGRTYRFRVCAVYAYSRKCSDEDGGGRWRFTREVPRQGWPLAWNEVRFTAQCTPFRHLGFFPDMTPVWEWMRGRLDGTADAETLNLFGYTGVGTLALSRFGRVTHVDARLVGHVGARDGGRSVGVHLLGELARDLHRLNLRGEGTAEHPLDEVLDALLKVSQDADGWLPSGSVRCACTGRGNAASLYAR